MSMNMTMTTLSMHTHRMSNMNMNLTMNTRLTTNVFPVKHNTDTNTNRNVFVNNFINELPKPPLRLWQPIDEFNFSTDNTMTMTMNMNMTMNTNTKVKKFKFNMNVCVNDFVNKPSKLKFKAMKLVENNSVVPFKFLNRSMNKDKDKPLEPDLVSDRNDINDIDDILISLNTNMKARLCRTVESALVNVFVNLLRLIPSKLISSKRPIDSTILNLTDNTMKRPIDSTMLNLTDNTMKFDKSSAAALSSSGGGGGGAS